MIKWNKQKQALDTYVSQFENQVVKHKKISEHCRNNKKDVKSLQSKMILESRMFYIKGQINLLTLRAKIANIVLQESEKSKDNLTMHN